ncbi:MAG: ABC transporter permease [Gammaproteobacteria bacterium]|nr:ABC transporter permease [Gammaproteobacteria bacterium]
MNHWAVPLPRAGAIAVWRRNALVWRKLVHSSVLLNFGEPLLMLLGLGFGLGRFIGDMAGMPYLTFLASGLLASSAMNTASFEALYSVFTRMVPQQTYDAMLATPLAIDDIVAGEMLWCATKSLMSSSAILIVAWALGGIREPTALACIPVFFLAGLCFAGPALLVSALSPSYDFFSYYTTLVITPMFIFCGVFYPISTLPGWLQIVVQGLPLTHAIALIRPLAGGAMPESVLAHVAVLLVYAGAGFYCSVAAVRRRLLK